MASRLPANRTDRLPARRTSLVRRVPDQTETAGPVLDQSLMRQVIESLWMPAELGEDEQLIRITSAIRQVEEIRPRDGLEGMLAAQMVATHNAAMECLRRANIQGQTSQGRDQNLRQAIRLLNLYTQQMAALNKHRGKGQQTVVVEHRMVGADCTGHLSAQGGPVRAIPAATLPDAAEPKGGRCSSTGEE